ncbi:hypothetical protein EYR41_000052 [Orbilia oligospora]|uniref:Uncharacterized protein n=1 Tax=Orbilia oligospora TaxID=2813651 RepID=A0A8H2E902_ORBOL|nr:hypothetical protein EYR41_000052 [Orbilia oligospora]
MYSIENQLSGYGNSKSHSEAIETALFTKYLSPFTLGDDSQLRSESKCDVIYSREILSVHDPIDSARKHISTLQIYSVSTPINLNACRHGYEGVFKQALFQPDFINKNLVRFYI